MTSRSVTIRNQLGMHARAAARFVRTASAFTSQVWVAHGEKVMDGKSILGILLLAAGRGSSLTISADGRDELAAVNELVALVDSGFGEFPCNG